MAENLPVPRGLTTLLIFTVLVHFISLILPVSWPNLMSLIALGLSLLVMLWSGAWALRTTTVAPRLRIATGLLIALALIAWIAVLVVIAQAIGAAPASELEESIVYGPSAIAVLFQAFHGFYLGCITWITIYIHFRRAHVL